jgi:3-hydroxybutyryl-CoA dehydratase
MHPEPLETALRIGATSAGSMTVTETHIVVGAGLIGGFQAGHVDHEYARSIGLKPILHGSLTAAIMSAVIGRFLPSGGWTLLEQSTRYRAPVHAGDTLSTTWKVSGHLEKPGLAGIIVALDGQCVNQNAEFVAESQSRLLWHKGCRGPTT